MRRGWGLVSALCAVVLVSSVSHAAHAQQVVQQTNVSAPQSDGPSIISSAWSGLTAGAAVGVSGGYLWARTRGDGHFNRDHDRWRALGLGAGIGALAGAGIGLTLGFVDKAGAPGGRYVARDLAAGAGFGAVIGVISGGIAAGIQGKPERVLFGTAIGVISGAGLGIITGIVEGISKRHHTVTATSRLHVEPSLAMARQVNGSNVMVPGVSGSF